MNHLFRDLDRYLDENGITEKKKHIDNRNACCKEDENFLLSPHLLVYVCGECGTVKKMEPYQIEERDPFKNTLDCKTFIPYNSRLRHLARIHTWTSKPYPEQEIERIYRYMQGLDFDRNIIRVAKIQMNDFYTIDKIVSRNNVRRGLICYCIYQSHLYLKIPCDIDELFVKCNINHNNYNSAVVKLKDEEKIFYPVNMNKYIKLIGVDVDKDDIMKYYTKLILSNCKHNKKSYLVSVFYYLTDKAKDVFKISNKTLESLTKILKEENDIILI